MKNNVTAILWFFTLIVVFCRSDAATIKDSCPFPLKLKNNYDFNWRTRSSEWSNTNAKPAFLQLVLSWTPTFCESLTEYDRTKEFQCVNKNHFNMVVHGLWPQASRATSVRAHPRNCQDDKQLNATFIKRFYCMMPDEDLIQSQWEKHGSCHYKTAMDYYTIVEKLYKSLNIPDIQSIKNPTITTIKNAFFLRNPKLFSSAIYVSMNSQDRLKEIKICYDLSYQFVSCYS